MQVIFKIGDEIYLELDVINAFSCYITSIIGQGYMYEDTSQFELISSEIGAYEWSWFSDRIHGDVVIPDGIKNITSHMFHCNNTYQDIDTLYIGKDVEYIGERAFYSLLGKGVKRIENSSFVLTTLGVGCFENNGRLEYANFNGTVTSIGEKCFLNCFIIESLNLSNDLDIIYPMTFNNCHKLKTFNRSNKISSFDTSSNSRANGIFLNCNNIEFFTFTDSCDFDLNSYVGANFFGLALDAGSNCNEDGLQITRIYTSNPQAMAYNWIGFDNRYAIFIQGIEFIFCAHKGKWIKIMGYNKEIGDIPVSHEQLYLWIRMLKQGDVEGSPIFVAHNGSWYQIGY